MYETSNALCDVKGCPQPQCGEFVEIECLPPYELAVRVHPCRSHLPILTFGVRMQVTSGL